jgi:hypothetical protein
MSKYHNIKTVIDGITFASKKEAKRYQDLKLLLKAGEISELTLQPKFDLTVNGHKIGSYIADFQYREKTNGRYIVEDVKGMVTPVYRLKAKLVKALHGVTVTEI